MFLIYTPQPALQHLVSRIMFAHYVSDPGKPRPINPFPPHPEHCMYFYPIDKVVRHNDKARPTVELPHSIIVGPKLNKVDLALGYNTLVVIVCFQPGGLHRLLRISMNDILDEFIDSSLLFGGDIENVIQQIRDSASYEQMNRIVQEFLLSKAKNIRNTLPIDEVLTGINRHKELVNIDKLATQACVSIRQLERQFSERIGIPPKMFSRLVRFSRAWDMRENNPAIPWTKIAHACDYADQMHMIRDFKEFTGVTPTILQTHREKSPFRLTVSTE